MFLHTVMAIDDGSALKTLDTVCGNVKEPFWFAQPGDAMTGSIGQGSPAAEAPHHTLLSVKRSSSLVVVEF